MSSDPPSNDVPAESMSPPSPRPASRESWRILVSLMFPAMLMPMTGSMSRVALPIIRDDFGLQAEMVAWVSAAFTLPLMILMPLYGRLADVLDRRRLLLVGIALFTAGTALTLVANGIPSLIVGRVVQGLGVAGMMPLGIAIITTRFRPHERGKAMGTWSTIGPSSGFVAPLIAGFLVALWGWRGAFAPPLLLGLAAFTAVYVGIPPRKQSRTKRYFRSFDWGGVLLLSAALTSLIFYFSSRAITGVPPLRDVRLLAAALVLTLLLYRRERRHPDPFVALDLFANRMFTQGTFCATMRMFGMAATSFLMPLYLVDIHHMGPARLGGFLMISAGAMALVVRIGGGLSDRFSSRWPVTVGLLLQAAVFFLFARLSENDSLWVIAACLTANGLSVGIMLAPLHRAVMRDIPDTSSGAAAGLYSMFRFLGVVIGVALCGLLLQRNLDIGLSPIEAYQDVFLFFIIFPLIGGLAAATLRETDEIAI